MCVFSCFLGSLCSVAGLQDRKVRSIHSLWTRFTLEPSVIHTAEVQVFIAHPVQGSASRAVGSFEAVLEVPESASSRGVPSKLKICGWTPTMVQEVHEGVH